MSPELHITLVLLVLALIANAGASVALRRRRNHYTIINCRCKDCGSTRIEVHTERMQP